MKNILISCFVLVALVYAALEIQANTRYLKSNNDERQLQDATGSPSWNHTEYEYENGTEYENSTWTPSAGYGSQDETWAPSHWNVKNGTEYEYEYENGTWPPSETETTAPAPATLRQL